MPAPAETHSRNQSTDSTDPQDRSQTSSSVGLGVDGDSVIPPSHNARTVVLCLDGTGDQFDGDNSNIVQFFSMLKKDDKSKQVVYYQSGIGTYTIPNIVSPLRSNLHKLIDMAVANHLDAHVMGGYEFLMENYQEGDKICIFGFSRGAYTARALAGMIQKVGLLPAGNRQQVPFAYKMYGRDDETGWRQSIAFKKAFSIDVEIEFVGVWDTVSSVGIVPRTLPFTASSTSIRYFRHAISLDERRAKFKPNYYHLQRPDDQKGTKPGEMPRSSQFHWRFRDHNKHQHHRQKDKVLSDEENDDGLTATDVLEVWFAGCHSDIGGGSVPNGTRNSLARIPLRWMIRQCFLANTGIQFYRKTFKHIGLDPTTLYPFLTTRPPALETSAPCVAEARASTYCPDERNVTFNDQAQASPIAACTFKSEEHEELLDALSPIYDQLELLKPWWILEILPLRHLMQDRKEMSWKHVWEVNLGRGRRVPEPVCERGEKALVHRSVKTRMDADCLESGKYHPKAKSEHCEFVWVD